MVDSVIFKIEEVTTLSVRSISKGKMRVTAGTASGPSGTATPILHVRFSKCPDILAISIFIPMFTSNSPGVCKNISKLKEVRRFP